MPEPIIVSWSGGKDSAMMLEALRASDRWRPVALLTAVTTGYDRVSIHGVRRTLLEAQAAAVGLPLQQLELKPDSSNAAYEAALTRALERLGERFPDVHAIAFGDLFLEDVRRYREEHVTPLGFEPVFPLWGEPTDDLARRFTAGGYAARIVCVDTTVLPATFSGRPYDTQLLRDLPADVDPCGERGEFHTFVSVAPSWSTPVRYEPGEVVLRDGRFAYCDLVPPPQ